MTEIRHLQDSDLEQLQTLINRHLGSLVPGWGLPEEYIVERLRRNPDEYIVDPWVESRKTLVAVEEDGLQAAAHILKYLSGSPRDGSGEIGFILYHPENRYAGEKVLEAALSKLARMGTRKVTLAQHLFVPVVVGVPDEWPHIRRLVEESGFVLEDGHREAIYAGEAPAVDVCEPPVSGLSVERTMGLCGTRFAARLKGEPVSRMECVTDLTKGGRLWALSGWAELTEVETKAEWRGRGIGSWLMAHVAAWVRLGGISRIILCTGEDDEAAGAGRFYARFGLKPITRLERGWIRSIV